MASNSDTPTLPRYTQLSPTDPFSILHKLLWPTTDRPPNPTLHGPECRGLAPYTETYTTNSEPWSTVHYIDLAKYPSLRVHRLASLDTLIVRQEYLDFLTEVQEGYRFCVAGEHGIGNSVGASYFLLHLLACGQSVFFVPDPDVIYYFSDSGVQVFRGPYQGYMATMKSIDHALGKSWVLIDVDASKHPNWSPPWWTCLSVGLVYTTMLDTRSARWFIEHFVADTRNMQPLSLEELEALSLWVTDKNFLFSSACTTDAAMEALQNAHPPEILGRRRR